MIRRRVSSLIMICFLLLAVFISGCTLQISATQTPALIYNAQTELALSGNDSLSYPILHNIKNEEDLNRKLTAYFDRIVKPLKTACENGAEVSIEYTLSADGNDYLLQSTIINGQNAACRLPDVLITQQGTCVAPAWQFNSLQSPKFLNALFALAKHHIETDFSILNNEASSADLSSLLVRVYEEVSGKEPDISRVKDGKDNQVLYRKARELNLIQYDPESFYTNTEKISLQSAAQMVAALKERIDKDAFQQYSEPVTLSEALPVMQLFFDMQMEPTHPSPTNEDQALSQWYSKINNLKLSESITGTPSAIPQTRKLWAANILQIYESAFGTIPTASISDPFSDTRDTAARKTVGASLLSYFPVYDFFSPDYIIRMHNLPDYARYFYDGCYYNWCIATNKDNLYYQPILYEQAVVYAGTLLGSYEGKTPVHAEIITIENTRPYDWYFSQYNTGEYSYVNCMPTVTCMALKWKDPKFKETPADLRKLYPEIKSGWYMAQIQATLEKYKVSYDLKETEKENICDDLDNGRIALVQISEGDPSQQGHCMVIYGYKKFGTSVTFLVNDPEISSVPNLYGEPAGKALELDSDYCMFIIQRFSYYYASIMG